MLKKYIASILILWLVSVAGLSWAFTQQKKEKQFLQQQKQTLSEELETLDQASGGDKVIQALGNDILSFVNIVLDKQSLDKLNKFKQQRKVTKLVFSASIICLICGGIILASWPLVWFAKLIFSVACRLWEKTRRFKKVDLEKLIKIPAKQNKDFSEHDQNPIEQFEFAGRCDQTLHHGKEIEEIAMLYCDEQSIRHQDQLGTSDIALKLHTKPFANAAQFLQSNIISDYHEKTIKLEDSLKTQTKTFEKQVSEFRQMAKVIKDTAIENANPINNALEELTQQVSAIREYASHQQTRMEKLQQGYDWNIIRTFCLRVIRCIDNLENRITMLTEKNADTTDLELIKDELVFALESSGVEQFEPQIHSDYRGQEKTAEVIKEKEKTQDPEMKGKIAEIIKLGYRYVIDETSVKVVRSARVKLFSHA